MLSIFPSVIIFQTDSCSHMLSRLEEYILLQPAIGSRIRAHSFHYDCYSVSYEKVDTTWVQRWLYHSVGRPLQPSTCPRATLIFWSPWDSGMQQYNTSTPHTKTLGIRFRCKLQSLTYAGCRSTQRIHPELLPLLVQYKKNTIAGSIPTYHHVSYCTANFDTHGFGTVRGNSNAWLPGIWTKHHV